MWVKKRIEDVLGVEERIKNLENRVRNLENLEAELVKTEGKVRDGRDKTFDHIRALEIINNREQRLSLPKYQLFFDTREARGVDKNLSNLTEAVGACMSAQWDHIYKQVRYGRYSESEVNGSKLFTFDGVDVGGEGPLVFTKFMDIHITQPDMDNLGRFLVNIGSVLWMGGDRGWI